MEVLDFKRCVPVLLTNKTNPGVLYISNDTGKPISKIPAVLSNHGWIIVEYAIQDTNNELDLVQLKSVISNIQLVLVNSTTGYDAGYIVGIASMLNKPVTVFMQNEATPLINIACTSLLFSMEDLILFLDMYDDKSYMMSSHSRITAALAVVKQTNMGFK